MNTSIKYGIVNRGKMIVTMGEKSVAVSGELNFEPSIFYAKINSIKCWNPPFQDEAVSEEDKQKMIEFITENGPKDIKTEIIFR
jgi:hypothetical protein